ncbi:hypothetical protein BDV26DRAFT_290973 [Aspergillus bertholletiae]|uniref:Uncharacterized protein n=1 Tax=Aspergillus bertholletiae TaxID=1226010 RepID=A0A5N7BDF5_9EURO|nr:hypothetical protein BDV26DRAFT_290973 [Aspergillus bertholletiae]
MLLAEKVLSIIVSYRTGYPVSCSGLACTICGLAGFDKCEEVAAAVTFSLDLVFTAAAEYSGADPVFAPELPGLMKVASYQTSLAAALAPSDLEYKTIDSAPLQKPPQERGKGAPLLLEWFVVRGLRSTSKSTAYRSNAVQDIFLHHYSNGSIVLHLPTGESLSAESFNQRHDQIGLKVSFTTHSESKLSRKQQAGIAREIVAIWQHDATASPMDDYIGFVEKDNKAEFCFRIIPETKGLGNSCESPDACGGMAATL